MKLTSLGTNGFFPSFGRQTACFAVPTKNTLIILDAGSGLFRLAEPIGKTLLKSVKKIHLFLSHCHLDHTFGFYAAFEFFKDKKVSVFAHQGRQVFSEFVTLDHFPVDYQKLHKNFSFKVVKEGSYDMNQYKVSVRKQNHRGEVSLAYRFDFTKVNGGSLAYVTDGEPTWGSVKFIKGVNLLLHEHEPAKKKSEYKPGIKLEKLIHEGHVTTEGAALTAKKASVGKLYLIHHNPYLDDSQLDKEVEKARKIFLQTYLAKDLEEIKF